MIEGRKVSMSYPLAGGGAVRVIQGADFRIETGAIRALVGRSGTGKSTLLNLIGGLDRPTGGEILIDGRHLESMSDAELSRFRNATVGFVFQSFFLRSLRTALDNVIVPLLFGNVPPAEARRRGRQALEEVGLGSLAETQVRRLSGGQRQRVAIARAIITRPSLLLADEPTGNLDTQTSLEIFELLHRLNRERGTTIVIVTHDPLVEQFQIPKLTVADGKVVPYEGKI